MQVGVDHQTLGDDRLGAGRRLHARTAQHRLHPRDQLAHAERLAQVVVAADAERVHLVVLGAARADDHDRRLDALRAQRLGDPPAVGAGQHQVDHGHVGALVAELRDRAVAVLGDLDVHARAAQVRRHGVGDHVVVFGDQDSRHALIVDPDPDQRFAAPACLLSTSQTDFRVTSTVPPSGFNLLGCPGRRRGETRAAVPPRQPPCSQTAEFFFTTSPAPHGRARS